MADVLTLVVAVHAELVVEFQILWAGATVRPKRVFSRSKYSRTRVELCLICVPNIKETRTCCFSSMRERKTIRQIRPTVLLLALYFYVLRLLALSAPLLKWLDGRWSVRAVFGSLTSIVQSNYQRCFLVPNKRSSGAGFVGRHDAVPLYHSPPPAL